MLNANSKAAVDTDIVSTSQATNERIGIREQLIFYQSNMLNSSPPFPNCSFKYLPNSSLLNAFPPKSPLALYNPPQDSSKFESFSNK